MAGAAPRGMRGAGGAPQAAVARPAEGGRRPGCMVGPPAPKPHESLGEEDDPEYRRDQYRRRRLPRGGEVSAGHVERLACRQMARALLACCAVLVLAGCSGSSGPAVPTIGPARTFPLAGVKPAPGARPGPAPLSVTI